MHLDDAEATALRLMRTHGLGAWRFAFDRAKTRAGICRYDSHTIGLSRTLTQLHTDAEVRDTILHEIAHALVGPEHGHGRVWRARALDIGCSAQRCLSDAAPRPDAPWLGTCPRGHVVTRWRRPQRVLSCRRCSSSFDPDVIFMWRHHGEIAAMPPPYTKELATINRQRPVLPHIGEQLSLL